MNNSIDIGKLIKNRRKSQDFTNKPLKIYPKRRALSFIDNYYLRSPANYQLHRINYFKRQQKGELDSEE